MRLGTALALCLSLAGCVGSTEAKTEAQAGYCIGLCSWVKSSHEAVTKTKKGEENE